MSYLYQHAETYIMDTVRDELKKLNIPVLANIHDAIIVKHRISKKNLKNIEKKLHSTYQVKHFKLIEHKINGY